MLTPDQLIAFEAYETQPRVYISGPAGTGKSYLIQHIQADCRVKQIPFITLSSTGISAHHIGGMTVHGFLCRLRLKLIKPTPDTVFIVDEISMLGKKIFDTFETQLRKYASVEGYFDPHDYSSPFGHFKMVFFGDFAQLPPINDEFCFESHAWDFITQKVELTTIKRQTDLEFQTFLSHVRTGKLLQQDKDILMDLLRHPNQDATTHLFLSNAEAEEFNKKNLDRLVTTTHQSVVTLDSKVTSTLSEEENKTFFKENHHCYETLEICVGATCMLTANLDVATGWCNGTLGTIEAIRENEILIKNKKGEVYPIPRKTYQRVKQRIECDVIVGTGKQRYCGKTNCKHTPVYAVMDDDAVYRTKSLQSSMMMTVEQFPLLLAWGITIHKSQGMTLDSCAITLPFQYSPSLLYVALSRCMSLSTLSLRSESPIRFDQIRPSVEVMRAIFGWTERTCKLCEDVYIGPYTSFCNDCCSAPGKYSMFRFIDFIPAAMPSPAMMDYMTYAVKNPEKSTTVRWRKFVQFCVSQREKDKKKEV